MEKKPNISLVFKGLNQVYRHKKFVFTHYSQLTEYLETSKVLESKSQITKLFAFTSEKILEKLRDTFDFKLILSVDYEYDWKDSDESKHDKYLDIDKQLIEAQGLERFFIFQKWEKLKAEIELNPRSFVIFNENSFILSKYKKISCWTSLITDLFYSFFEDTDSYVKELVKVNTIEFPKQFSQKIDYFDFQSVSILQNAYYYNLIRSDPCISIQNYLKEHKVIKVLTLFRILPKISDFPKTDFLESNEKVIYINHLGGNDIALNNEFDMISPRITDYQDLIYYKELYENVNRYSEANHVLFINNPKYIEPFLYRGKMSQLLKTFSASMKLDCFEGLKVEFPNYLQALANSINDVNHFKQLLQSCNLELPLIIKYNSEVKEDNHLLTLVVSETGLLPLIEYYRTRTEDKLELIAQQFHNHGGVFAKTFYVKDEATVTLRSSFPDIPEEEHAKAKLYNDGHLFLNTKQIATEFLNKFSESGQQASLDFSKHNINKEFLLQITREFNLFSNVNLFSLDFVIDQKAQIYYILDCNFYPAYKEYKSGIGNLLADHHHLVYTKYFSQKQNKN